MEPIQIASPLPPRPQEHVAPLANGVTPAQITDAGRVAKAPYGQSLARLYGLRAPGRPLDATVITCIRISILHETNRSRLYAGLGTPKITKIRPFFYRTRGISIDVAPRTPPRHTTMHKRTTMKDKLPRSTRRMAHRTAPVFPHRSKPNDRPSHLSVAAPPARLHGAAGQLGSWASWTRSLPRQQLWPCPSRTMPMRTRSWRTRLELCVLSGDADRLSRSEMLTRRSTAIFQCSKNNRQRLRR